MLPRRASSISSPLRNHGSRFAVLQVSSFNKHYGGTRISNIPMDDMCHKRGDAGVARQALDQRCLDHRVHVAVLVVDQLLEQHAPERAKIVGVARNSMSGVRNMSADLDLLLG